MLEQYLICHCSPTLASLKTASVFRFPFSRERELWVQALVWDRRLKKKGISLAVLQKAERTALIYVYRPVHLRDDLQKEGVKEFLAGYGYQNLRTDAAIGRLRERLLRSDDFPHEMGIFLGYPLGDVIGFIENDGKNSKCNGFWKVYCNEFEAEKIFEKFRECRDLYFRMWYQGRSVLRLTVPD